MHKHFRDYFCKKYLFLLPKKILFGFLLALLLFLVYGIFPNRWYHVLYIYSGSMRPAISSGDLIVITPKPDGLEPGMVLTMSVNGQLVTHRLIDVQADGTLITKGDSNPVADDWDGKAVKVVGLFRFRIPYLGYLVDLVDVFSPSASGAWFFDEDKLDVSISTACKELKEKGTSVSADVTAVGGFNEPENIFSVSGDICVSNQGEVDTAGLKIIAQVEYKTKGGGKYQLLPSAVYYLEPSDVLSPGETRCYVYSINFEPVEEAHYRLSAQVFINNHSGWMPGGPHCGISEICPFGPVVKSEFDLPEVVDVGDDELEALAPAPDGADNPETTSEPEITETPFPSLSPETPSDNPPGVTPTPEVPENPDSTPVPPDPE